MKKKAYKMNKKELLKTMTFMEAYKKGLVKAGDIDEYVHQWHISDFKGEVYEFLGMTEQEYFDIMTDINLGRK